MVTCRNHIAGRRPSIDAVGRRAVFYAVHEHKTKS